mmetsp:Transcript_17804/g.42807  ORF Transcript_17804/g.42807 Transcript_17804/m.42807 type:complete len:145 (-) Transcript_17804:907-1341(-)
MQAMTPFCNNSGGTVNSCVLSVSCPLRALCLSHHLLTCCRPLPSPLRPQQAAGHDAADSIGGHKDHGKEAEGSGGSRGCGDNGRGVIGGVVGGEEAGRTRAAGCRMRRVGVVGMEEALSVAWCALRVCLAVRSQTPSAWRGSFG